MSGLQFKAELVRKIMRGEKSQTRRPVKADKPARWTEGNSYAIQPGRGKPAQCRVIVDEVRHELVGEITFDDARREGFRTTAEFAAYWVRLYEKTWVERLEANDPDDVEHALAVRFTERHARRPVWVVSFHLDTSHTPRYLSAAWPDYTCSPQLAMTGEPEALTEGELNELAKAAQQTHGEHKDREQQDRDAARALLSFERRLSDVRRRARLKRVDIGRELWMVERFISDRRKPHEILHKLAGAERRVDRAA